VRALVIEASVAVKWVVEEEGTAEALAILRAGKLVAPEFLIAECADILWKKRQRHELTNPEAFLAARLLKLREGRRAPFAKVVLSLAKAAASLEES
jgi:predicted nucleic acid-binding protein